MRIYWYPYLLDSYYSSSEWLVSAESEEQAREKIISKVKKSIDSNSYPRFTERTLECLERAFNRSNPIILEMNEDFCELAETSR